MWPKSRKIPKFHFLASFVSELSVQQDQGDVAFVLAAHTPCHRSLYVLLNFLVTVKAAPHECVIRTGLP